MAFKKASKNVKTDAEYYVIDFTYYDFVEIRKV